MSQLSYLQQIAQRASDRLPILMPPRSPFLGFDSSVPMEILDESPQSESIVSPEKRPSMLLSPTIAQTEPLANPLIQLPNTTLEPSPAMVSLTSPDLAARLEPSPTIASLTKPELPISTQVAFETISDVERSEPSKIPSLPTRVAQDRPAIAPQALQPQTERLPDRQPYAIATQNLSPQRTSRLAPSITEFSDSLVSQPTQAESLNENSLPIASPAILRWLTPTIQDRNVDMLFPEPQHREIYSEVTALPIASVVQEHLPKGNTLHIGAIDIQIMPAPIVPEAIAPSPTKSGSTTLLARSFSGSFGLRQG